MKKLLSMILCIGMILSFANIAAGAEDESLTTDTQTLKKFALTENALTIYQISSHQA